jgi:integrase
MKKSRKAPAYQLHKATGQAKVRIDGRDHYLGKHDSPESKDAYRRVIREWRAAQDGLVSTVGQIVDDFFDHAESYYRKGGKATSEIQSLRVALRFLEPWSDESAFDFGPRKLKKARDAMVSAGLYRESINQHIGRIRRMFRWAISEELVPSDVITALECVEGLRKGRTTAPESPGVQPIAAERIDALQEHVSPTIWGLIQFQRFTGCRPGEAVTVRGCDIDRSGEVWLYRPAAHKTEHLGRDRVVCIGPRAQTVLVPFLLDEQQSFLFSAAKARADFDQQRREARQSPMTPSQAARQPVDRPRRMAGDHYSEAAYRRAITRGCERAFGMPDELRKISRQMPTEERSRLKQLASEWRAQHCWSPNQLRHTAATEIRAAFGLEAAQVVLGHSNANTTEIYAEADLEKAKRAILQVG